MKKKPSLILNIFQGSPLLLIIYRTSPAAYLLSLVTITHADTTIDVEFSRELNFINYPSSFVFTHTMSEVSINTITKKLQPNSLNQYTAANGKIYNLD